MFIVYSHEYAGYAFEYISSITPQLVYLPEFSKATRFTENRADEIAAHIRTETGCRVDVLEI